MAAAVSQMVVVSFHMGSTQRVQLIACSLMVLDDRVSMGRGRRPCLLSPASASARAGVLSDPIIQTRHQFSRAVLLPL